MTKRRQSFAVAVDQERYEELFFRYYPRVRGFLARRLPQEDLDDVLAETFLIVWRRLDDLPPDGPPRTGWMLETARRTMLNHLRSHRRRNALRVRLAASQTPAPIEDAADRGVDGSLTEDLEAAFASLGPDDQLILSLVAWDRCSTEELAEVLGCTEGAARTRLSRARSRFRALLGDGRP